MPWLMDLPPSSKQATYHVSDPSSIVTSLSDHNQETFSAFKGARDYIYPQQISEPTTLSRIRELNCEFSHWEPWPQGNIVSASYIIFLFSDLESL